MNLVPLVVSFCVGIFMKFQVETAKYGPYKIELRKIEPCEDQGTNEVSFYNLTKRENGNHNVQINVERSMGRELKICIEAQEISSNGSTKFHQFNCKPCGEAWMFLGDFFTSLMIAAGVQQPEVCGFKQGNYTAINWDVSRPFRLIPRMNYNVFIFKASYYVQNNRVGCNLFTAKMSPKE